MTLWIQHGYGKGDKLDALATHSGVGGVVLSPADEQPTTLEETATDTSSYGWVVSVDPQTYVRNIPQGSGRLHEDNGLPVARLTWGLSPSEISDVVEATLELNSRLGTDVVLSPAPVQQSFGDVWAPVSLQFARATHDLADKPVYASVVVHEAGFSTWPEVELWLDELTRLDVEGVYLVVARSQRDYPPTWLPETLSNILRVIYRLGVTNRYEVTWGYSDLAGLLGIAAGADAACAGWFYTLRSFATSKWQPSSGGSQPIPRVLADGLLAPLEAPSEATQAVSSSIASRVITSEAVRTRIANEPQGWGQTDAWQQHMETLASAVEDLEEFAPGSSEALDYLIDRIGRARNDVRTLVGEGVALDPSHATSLENYQRALELLRTAEGI